MNIFEWTENTPVTANNLNEMENTLNGNIVTSINTNGAEVKTNVKIDGKDVYMKRFRASISNELQIPHGLTNFKLVDCSAFIDNAYDGNYRPIPNSVTNTFYTYQVNDTYIEYYQSWALTGYIEVTLYYIKTS